jgi:transposase
MNATSVICIGIDVSKDKSDLFPAIIFSYLNLYQLRELVRIRDRLVDKQTVCKVQLVRNIDAIWPGYSTVMKKSTGATSIAILKKYSVPSKVRAESFENFYDLVKKKSRSKISHTW